MKVNQNGEYLQEEGDIYAIDCKTEEEIVFYNSIENNILIRSMFEEDIDNVAKMLGLTSKEKKILKYETKRCNSEKKRFVIEEAIQFENTGHRKKLGTAGLLENGIVKIILHIPRGKDSIEYTKILKNRIQNAISGVRIDI